MTNTATFDLDRLYSSLIKLIRDERAERGVSQSDMATELDIAYATYSRMETMHTKLPLVYFLKICLVLGLKPDLAITRALQSSYHQSEKTEYVSEPSNLYSSREVNAWKDKYHEAIESFQMMKRYAKGLEVQIKQLEKDNKTLLRERA